jgi:ABC-type nitrate/sulfonate/bicarbonate transport system permease component
VSQTTGAGTTGADVAIDPASVAIADAGSPAVRARRWGRATLGLISVLAGLLLWESAGARGWVNRIILSPPHEVALAGLELARSGDLARHVAISLRELGVGLALAVIVGVPVGVFAGWSRRFSWILRPLTAVFYATPVIVFAPLIVAWLGIGFWDKVLLVFLEAFFQLFVTVSAGVGALNDAWLRVATAFAARPGFTFRSVVLPGSVPYIVAGARLATGRGLVTVVVAELLASTAGLGWMVAYYGQNFKTAYVFVALVVTAALGMLGDAGLRRLERQVERWRPPA